MAEKKKKSKNDFWIQVLLMIAFLAGLLIMLYPFYVESINNFIDNQRIEEAQKLDAKRNAKELAKRPQVLTGCHTTVNNNSHPVADLLHQTENVR